KRAGNVNYPDQRRKKIRNPGFQKHKKITFVGLKMGLTGRSHVEVENSLKNYTVCVEFAYVTKIWYL
ncbi:MAG: hypothetical protein ACYCZ2_19855, partial [Lutibacter sp.]